jgi:multidrug efflux pump subunit AcrA (membrane-fusion protein)
VVFQPGQVRVGAVSVAVGAKVGPDTPALTVTGLGSKVHVDLDAAKQTLAKKGAKVTVDMPDGKKVPGTIDVVGTTAKAGTDGAFTVDLEVSIDAMSSGPFDQAPVTVNIESERVPNVLSVPIEALLGLREGGFGVEVVEGAAKRIVAVKTGSYGGGRVEITGDGLSAGMKVVVPAS